jgi:hypothetical protein
LDDFEERLRPFSSLVDDSEVVDLQKSNTMFLDRLEILMTKVTIASPKPFGTSTIHQSLLEISDSLDSLNRRLNNIINSTEC